MMSKMSNYMSQDKIRSVFSKEMSKMYQNEVPAYGTLLDIVKQTNETHLATHSYAAEDTMRLTEERHGAIRVGTSDELAMITRIFAVMGMYPVSYYDLSSSGIPVHSTAFRPIEREALAENPFRVFTSLLRLELIEDETLKQQAQSILDTRDIFTERAKELTSKAETQHGLEEEDAHAFVSEVLETFRWTGKARVNKATYDALHHSHRLIADVVSFQGPHINHLTPRTLDIDQSHADMKQGGLPTKSVIEGPPRRQCPILLRQTSFKALSEEVQFIDHDSLSAHTARFGEIEQRGVALTPKGRALYDAILAKVRQKIKPAADGSNADAYNQALKDGFAQMPDTWQELHDQQLAYFRYDLKSPHTDESQIVQINGQELAISPIIYEDFLPVSAAGIFQSNLGDNSHDTSHAQSSREVFETALGRAILDEFKLYQSIQDESLKKALSSM